MEKLLLAFAVLLGGGCVMRTPDDCAFYTGSSRYACERDAQDERTERTYTAEPAVTFTQVSQPPVIQATYGRLYQVVSGSEVLLEVPSTGLVLVHLDAAQDTVANEILLQSYLGRSFQIIIVSKIASIEWVALLYDDNGGQLNLLLE